LNKSVNKSVKRSPKKSMQGSTKKRILVLVIGLWASLNFLSCSSSKAKGPPSGLPDRVLASQGVTSTNDFGSLTVVDAYNDTIPRNAHIGTGNSPGLMAVSPSLNLAATFDSASTTVYVVNTATESVLASVRLPAPTSSMVFPTANPTGYAAVPGATVTGYSFIGAVEEMNFTASALTTIAVTNAQTVVSNSGGSQLLVFSNNSDSMIVLSPAAAVPPVDLSCLSGTPNAVCTIVPGFDRPVYAVVHGNTAYILNCGPQCGGVMASVMVFDLQSPTITGTIPVDAATWALLTAQRSTWPALRPPTMLAPARLLRPPPAGASTSSTLDRAR